MIANIIWNRANAVAGIVAAYGPGVTPTSLRPMLSRLPMTPQPLTSLPKARV